MSNSTAYYEHKLSELADEFVEKEEQLQELQGRFDEYKASVQELLLMLYNNNQGLHVHPNIHDQTPNPVWDLLLNLL